MKTFNILRSLLENDAEQSEAKLLSDVWGENTDNVAAFRPIKKFAVKPAGNNMVELYAIDGDSRKLIKKISSEELKSKYMELEKGDKTDAEGFKIYTLNGNLEAIKYTGESVIVSNGGEHTSPLVNGDYLVKRPHGDGFEYLVVKQQEFENKYEEVV